MEHLLDQSVFEAMTLSALDEQGVFVNDAGHQGSLEAARCTPNVVPWDDPLSYAEHQLHELQAKGVRARWVNLLHRLLRPALTNVYLSLSLKVPHFSPKTPTTLRY